jgi:hypothetical protein
MIHAEFFEAEITFTVTVTARVEANLDGWN